MIQYYFNSLLLVISFDDQLLQTVKLVLKNADHKDCISMLVLLGQFTSALTTLALFKTEISTPYLFCLLLDTCRWSLEDDILFCWSSSFQQLGNGAPITLRYTQNGCRTITFVEIRTFTFHFASATFHCENQTVIRSMSQLFHFPKESISVPGVLSKEV